MPSDVPNCSVVVPFYNSKYLLPDFLRNTLKHIGERDELLLINDGSEDISFQECLELKNLDPRINVINKHHSGIVESLNSGIRAAKFEYIARLDVDDQILGSRLDKQKRILEKYRDCAVVFCDYEFIGNEKPLGVMVGAIDPTSVALSLIKSIRTPHPGAMFRKSIFNSVGCYNINEYPAEDLGLWMRFALVSELRSVPEIGLGYAISKGGISDTNREKMNQTRNLLVRNFLSRWKPRNIFEDLSTSFKSYAYEPLGMRRRILLYLDLVSILKFRSPLRLQVVRFILMRMPYMFDIRVILESAILWRETRVRRKFRK